MATTWSIDEALASFYLMEDGTGLYLLEDGSSFYVMEDQGKSVTSWTDQATV